MSRELLEFIGITVASLLNLALLVYQTIKKVPPEVEKMRAEKLHIYGELAESNMEGAQISNELLVNRINELKKERRDAWNHIAKLNKQLVLNKMIPVLYIPTESEPKIQSVKK